MIILLTILLTLLAIIVIAGVIVLIAAPLRITIRRGQETAIEIEFGRYMRDVWAGVCWFSVTRLYFDTDFNVEHADFIIGWFHGSEKQIADMNKKIDKDKWRKVYEAELDYYELDPGD